MCGAGVGECFARAMVVLVNWLGPTDDPTSADETAERFIHATSGSLRIRRQKRYEKYRLDVLEINT
jgi:hypothetical protein